LVLVAAVHALMIQSLTNVARQEEEQVWLWLMELCGAMDHISTSPDCPNYKEGKSSSRGSNGGSNRGFNGGSNGGFNHGTRNGSRKPASKQNDNNAVSWEHQVHEWPDLALVPEMQQWSRPHWTASPHLTEAHGKKSDAMVAMEASATCCKMDVNHVRFAPNPCAWCAPIDGPVVLGMHPLMAPWIG
jgi:hypothetical protein